MTEQLRTTTLAVPENATNNSNIVQAAVMSTGLSTIRDNLSYNQGPNKFTEPRWIAGEIMLLLITLATIYVFVALAYYSWRFRHRPSVSGCGQELRERYMHYSCAAVIFIAIARCVLHQVIAFLPQNDDGDLALCRSVLIASRIVYNMAICLTYVHLWLRQYMFYSKDELKHLRTGIQRFVNWSVLVLIISTSTVIAIITFIPLEGQVALHTYHRNKCNAFEYNTRLTLFLYAGLSLFYQVTLIILFLYPILRQKMNAKKEGRDKNGPPGSVPNIGYPTLWRGIRRGFVMTTVVIITDAIFGCLVWFLTRSVPGLLSSVIALNDVNLIINVTCCICTFRNWRKIVFGFPCCRKLGWDNAANWRLSSKAAAGRNGSLESNVQSNTEKTTIYDTLDKRHLHELTFPIQV